MTYHARRRKAAAGSAGANPNGHKLSPRIAVSIPDDDMRVLTWWASKKGKPVASVIRDAVWAYLLPVRADAEKERQ